MHSVACEREVGYCTDRCHHLHHHSNSSHLSSVYHVSVTVLGTFYVFPCAIPSVTLYYLSHIFIPNVVTIIIPSHRWRKLCLDSFKASSKTYSFWLAKNNFKLLLTSIAFTSNNKGACNLSLNVFSYYTMQVINRKNLINMGGELSRATPQGSKALLGSLTWQHLQLLFLDHLMQCRHLINIVEQKHHWSLLKERCNH